MEPHAGRNRPSWEDVTRWALPAAPSTSVLARSLSGRRLLAGAGIGAALALGALHMASSTPGPSDSDVVQLHDQAATTQSSEPDALAHPSQHPTGQDAADAAPMLVVHVTGHVAQPQVVELEPGSRVADAIEQAGGLTPEADVAAINLARALSDGEQIYVPAPGETPPASAQPQSSPSTQADSGGALININTASAADLEQLPGIGPSLAARILEHRDTNGPFSSVDDLTQVSGIGPKTLEKFRERVNV